MTGAEEMLVHATCVAIGEVGVLLRGPSGSGKSDLALRLIEGGAKLVADDQVVLFEVAGSLLASAPEVLRGKIEVRGCGILDIPYEESVSMRLVIDLVQRDKILRLPEPACCDCAGRVLPLYRLHAFDASCSAKVRSLAMTLD
jgi:serine kinase of HPr protein (carbohydrate metabolism regulator)